MKLPAVATDAVTRTVYSTDNSIYQVAPFGVATPTSASEIGALIASLAKAQPPRPIVARGGGTGTNGQSLTDGVVIDVKRHLNRVISIDPDARTAVVEPGLVSAKLNEELAPHGLFWAPHTSTLNRATVGGMISTDAAGKGSLVHGRAHRHVISLDVVLDDGTPWTAKPERLDHAERLAAEPGRVGEVWAALLELPVTENGSYGLPDLARGFSGYGIDRVRRDGLIDPIPLLCGSEGTLAVITQATISLTPLPAHTALVVASYNSFADALDDAIALASTKPTAIESFDETTLERGRSSPAWPALGSVVGEHRGSVLLLEYTGDAEPDLGPVMAALERTGRSRAVQTLDSAVERAAAWKVRADAVGLLAKVATGGPELSARPIAFVEDCAVPVEAMSGFIAGFREVLDSFDLEYGMFGHADVGCVHVRPALDLSDPGHERLVRTVTERVTKLVAEHGGVLWGEHGRGFRGDVVSEFLSEDTINIMREVKTAFDPNDLFNPGKLYRPAASTEPIVALDRPALRGQVNRSVPVEIRREFDDAFACNGNGLCHHYGGAEAMCPSYKATGDPALSPKGRADLVRGWLADRSHDGSLVDQFEDAIAANLHQCLSCSACTGHCPVEVDIPELKSQFLEKYYGSRRRPFSHAILSRFEQLAFLGAKTPWLAGFGAGPAGRLLGMVDLPAPGRRHPSGIARFNPSRPSDVVVMPDVFTAALEPVTLAKAGEVLSELGYAVSQSRFVASGKFDHVKGRRTAFAAAVEAQAALVNEVLTAGAVPVVIEPAVSLLHGHEYSKSLPSYPAGVLNIVDVIAQRLDAIQKVDNPQTVNLLGHCTERTMSPANLASWQRILEAAGHTVSAPAVGCCGMAGIFGHEKANQEMSRKLFDLTWTQEVNTDSAVAATGYSCRSQTKRLSRAEVRHPIHLL